MMDQSVSMFCPAADSACANAPATTAPPTRWTSFQTAISGFSASTTAANFGLGIGFFHNDAECNPATYAAPVVPITAMPQGGTLVVQAAAARSPSQNTPTVPALQGAIQYATTYTKNTPGHRANVVFITDGYPYDGCGSTVQGAADAAQAGFNATPSITTYVIGMGNTAALDQIALAGSGGTQHYFPAQGDVSGALIAALQKITTVSISCDYSIPTGGAMLDYAQVNVQTILGDTGTPTMVLNVGDASKCGVLGGWYYDVNPNPPMTVPTKITLCPQSCDPLKAVNGSSLNVIIGCAMLSQT
jgi:hypothetical protein